LPVGKGGLHLREHRGGAQAAEELTFGENRSDRPGCHRDAFADKCNVLCWGFLSYPEPTRACGGARRERGWDHEEDLIAAALQRVDEWSERV
jgi:hypothetical protein